MNLRKFVHDLLCRPKTFFEPRSLDVDVFYGVDTAYGGGGERIMLGIKSPRVILVTDKAIHQWDPEAPTLKELGYVEYDKSIVMRATYYARRPWVYLLKTRIWLVRRWWRLLDVTHGRLWHSISPDGRSMRWRDARPGSGALKEARADAAVLRMQIEAQYKEINVAKEEKEQAYLRGVTEGIDSHRRVVEQFIDGVVQKTKD